PVVDVALPASRRRSPVIVAAFMTVALSGALPAAGCPRLCSSHAPLTVVETVAQRGRMPGQLKYFPMTLVRALSGSPLKDPVQSGEEPATIIRALRCASRPVLGSVRMTLKGS